MRASVRERLIQVSIGVGLVLLSGWYLWHDTIKVLVDRKISPDKIGDVVRLGVHYLAMQARAEQLAKKRAELLLEARKRREEMQQTAPKEDEAQVLPPGSDKPESP
ncbi:MAG: hypothetical protein EBS01_10435 [Verrucomicrobia bacterium]|nr:hypothetical protein [Verrucomicrobiota bacterium]